MVSWIDVADIESGDVTPGLSREQALKRFHVIDRDGRIKVGALAFSCLWTVLPAFQPFGKALQIWPISWFAARAYDAFLVIRPRLQNVLRRYEKNPASPANTADP